MKNATRVLFLFLFALACGENRGDPISASINRQFGGSLISGGHLPNVAVSEDTKFDFIQLILQQVWNSYDESVHALAKIDDNVSAIRVLGNFKGHTVSEKIFPDESSLNSDDPPSSEDSAAGIPNWEEPGYTKSISRRPISGLLVVFNDFSNTGRLFYGGTVECYGSWSPKYAGYRKLNGGLSFSGDYSGTVEFDNFLLEQSKLLDFSNPNVPVKGSVTIVSGSSRIIFNPYGPLLP
ncbi:MAG: hypothetical protein FVQ81_13840 [Candidatus Glassbacteria bacterium]|nr:hypothetical protein [Candidatus Glassbacteria bacterium]